MSAGRGRVRLSDRRLTFRLLDGPDDCPAYDVRNKKGKSHELVPDNDSLKLGDVKSCDALGAGHRCRATRDIGEGR